ncbi:hypothetical protein CASFOL_042017 [Castilleja foliolosa]|uniref:RING-type domain-containing protein n=1 Tax=Castilleja foliolosa TaxID=1961234 RepID=A0ABD3B9B3_9LAMI
MAIQAQIYSSFAFGGSQDYLMDNACGYNNNQYKLQQEQQLMQRVPPPFHPKNNTMDDQHSVAFSQTLSAHIENQKSEIDFFIHSQNERLRIALQEQRKQQISALMAKYESKIQFLLTQKEEEIEIAAKRSIELQGFLKKMEIESQTWQRLARENEAMAASLSSTIERLRETAAVNNAADDAESCDGGEQTARMVCKSCNYREACVIMVPCRHLCSCRECDAFLGSCPVCMTVKKASIEALI